MNLQSQDSGRRLLIAPSILSADFRALESEVQKMEKAGADLIHCDVMDGHFVPNITFGPMVVAAVRKATALPLDVHLMIAEPDKYIQGFRKAGADSITIHAEVCANPPDVLRQIAQSGARAGICVNPDTEVDLFLSHLPLVNMVLIMTVYAGFGGQKFIPETVEKIKRVRDEIVRRNLDIDLEVDGGINAETAATAIRAGANVLVAGSYLFGASDYRERIALLKRTGGGC